MTSLLTLAPISRSSGQSQPPPPPVPASPISNLSEGLSRSATKATLTLGGYVEAFYQWNFNDPSNGITNYRGFDNRHNSFTIANAVLDAQGTLYSVSAHLALQVGHTPETYYLSEPFSQGTNAAGSTGAQVWKYLQQANVGWTAPLGRGLLVEAGIFLSPIGPEGMAIKDQWNWSRSDLFFGLPFYHTGARVTYPFTSRLSASFMVCNGWNSVVDNNPEKSLYGQVTYNVPDKLTLDFLYFTGVERPVGAPEGRAWRHLFDAYAAWYPRPWLSLLLHVNAGFEPNAFGVSSWGASALYTRFRILKWLYFAARGDFFYESRASNSMGTASPIFWPVSWLSSGTATIELRPVDNLSFRIEYRHDQAAGRIYFQGMVLANVRTGDFIPDADAQDTLTLGAVAWF